MSTVLIYSKPGCAYCEKAKNLLKIRNVAFTESVLGADILTEDFVSMFPDVKSVPLIIVDGVKIGGYHELVEHIAKRPEFLAG